MKSSYVRRAIAIGLSVLCVASTSNGQTLFASPDTTPDYPKYQHIEECWQAGLRVSRAHRTRLDSIWKDTLIRETREELGILSHRFYSMSRRPDAAIRTAVVCLQKFNADTLKIFSSQQALRIVRVLLIAHRDEDADRFAQRFLDSLRRKSEKNPDAIIRKGSLKNYKAGLSQLMREYGSARPVRYDVAKQYYRRLLAERVGDSLYYTIDAAIDMSDLAHVVDDSVDGKEAQLFAIRINDSTPEEERLKSPRSTERLRSLAGFMARSTKHEALDSIAISTVAYNLWYANTVHRRVYGGAVTTREKAQPKKMPEIGGAYYYIADKMSPDTLRKGLASYTRNGAVPKDEFPVKNRINYFRPMPSLCHTQTGARSVKDVSYKNSYLECIGFAAEIRQFKRDYPEIEITGLSNTYGTVGHLGPLKPAEEADTLAKLFLGFYHLPVRLVVENTEFFHLEAPDGRRIDLPTANSEALGFSILDKRSLNILTDKEGYMLNVPSIEDAEWFKRFYEILRDRKNQ